MSGPAVFSTRMSGGGTLLLLNVQVTLAPAPSTSEARRWASSGVADEPAGWAPWANEQTTLPSRQYTPEPKASSLTVYEPAGTTKVRERCVPSDSLPLSSSVNDCPGASVNPKSWSLFGTASLTTVISTGRTFCIWQVTMSPFWTLFKVKVTTGP